MKKTLISIFAAFVAFASASADDSKMYLYKKNGEIIEYKIDEVDSLTFTKVQKDDQPVTPVDDSEMPTAQEYMNAIKSTITKNVPSNVQSGNNGTIQNISYYSKKARKNKKAAVWLPKGYDKNKKYPVLYVNHGIFGDESSMQNSQFHIGDMATKLIESGEAKEMIMVYTMMYTNPNADQCSGITTQEESYYDDFLEDLTESLIPYINENFSTYTDRDHTAISGFSMGGRESLYIGVSKPDVFGYIGCACPAPGVTPGQDNFGYHPGNFQKSELKFKDGQPTPYVFIIAGGTSDNVVGTFPQEYHQTLTDNNVDHIWIEIAGGGHDQSVIVPLYYNFIRSIFKTKADF